MTYTISGCIPLHLRHPLQIQLDVVPPGHDHRQDQEQVDGDEDRVQLVPAARDQHVLHRDGDVEGDDQRDVIGRLGRRERDELAQRQRQADRVVLLVIRQEPWRGRSLWSRRFK